MSTKRILGIALFGVLFIAAVVGILLPTLYIARESETIALPDALKSSEAPPIMETDALDRVEVTTETIQAVVAMLSRPEKYSRDVKIASYWEGGQIGYDVSVSVAGNMTSLKTASSLGVEKRIIITPDKLYIWYKGDRAPYIGNLDSSGDVYRSADEWQMLVTYEDVLKLDKKDIIGAGYIEYKGEDCVYAKYRSPLLNYTRTFYISLDAGLVAGAEEYDESGKLIYSMEAGELVLNEFDPAAFILPDGTDLLE